jgi:hypothetical protein
VIATGVAVPDTVVLRPRLGRRIFLCGSTLGFTALGAVLLVGSEPSGLIILAVFGPMAAITTPRLVVRRAYTTVLEPHGFVVHDSFGRVAHRVAWIDLAELVMVPVHAPLGVSREPLVGWRCEPRRPKRQGIARRLLALSRLVDVDGVLPDPYRGFESTIDVLADYANRPHGMTSGAAWYPGNT